MSAHTLIDWINKSFKFTSCFVFFVRFFFFFFFLGRLHNGHIFHSGKFSRQEIICAASPPTHTTAQSITVLMHLGCYRLMSCERDRSKINTRWCTLPDRFDVWLGLKHEVLKCSIVESEKVNRQHTSSRLVLLNFISVRIWLKVCKACVKRYFMESWGKGWPRSWNLKCIIGNLSSPMLIDRSFKQHINKSFIFYKATFKIDCFYLSPMN